MAAGTRPAVEISGARETGRALRRMAERLDDTDRMRDAAAERVRRRAVALVPRDSGALAGTIRTDEGEIVAGGLDVPYAGVIEGGWPARGIEPARYLAGALAEADAAGEIREAYAEGVGELVIRLDRET